MRKRITLLAALLVFCLTAATALAVTQSFPKFSVDVPADWLMQEQQGVISFTAPDQSAAIAFFVSDLKDSMSDLAAAMSAACGGSTPESKDGMYGFTCGPDGGTVIVLWQHNTDYVMVVYAGDHPQLEDISNSLELK